MLRLPATQIYLTHRDLRECRQSSEQRMKQKIQGIDDRPPRNPHGPQSSDRQSAYSTRRPRQHSEDHNLSIAEEQKPDEIFVDETAERLMPRERDPAEPRLRALQEKDNFEEVYRYTFSSSEGSLSSDQQSLDRPTDDGDESELSSTSFDGVSDGSASAVDSMVTAVTHQHAVSSFRPHFPIIPSLRVASGSTPQLASPLREAHAVSSSPEYHRHEERVLQYLATPPQTRQRRWYGQLQQHRIPSQSSRMSSLQAHPVESSQSDSSHRMSFGSSSSGSVVHNTTYTNQEDDDSVPQHDDYDELTNTIQHALSTVHVDDEMNASQSGSELPSRASSLHSEVLAGIRVYNDSRSPHTQPQTPVGLPRHGMPNFHTYSAPARRARRWVDDGGFRIFFTPPEPGQEMVTPTRLPTTTRLLTTRDDGTPVTYTQRVEEAPGVGLENEEARLNWESWTRARQAAEEQRGELEAGLLRTPP